MADPKGYLTSYRQGATSAGAATQLSGRELLRSMLEAPPRRGGPPGGWSPRGIDMSSSIRRSGNWLPTVPYRPGTIRTPRFGLGPLDMWKLGSEILWELSHQPPVWFNTNGWHVVEECPGVPEDFFTNASYVFNVCDTHLNPGWIAPDSYPVYDGVSANRFNLNSWHDAGPKSVFGWADHSKKYGRDADAPQEAPFVLPQVQYPGDFFDPFPPATPAEKPDPYPYGRPDAQPSPWSGGIGPPLQFSFIPAKPDNPKRTRKLLATRTMAAIAQRSGFNFLTEFRDGVQVLWKNLDPKDRKYWGRPSMQRMIEDIWNNFDKIHWNQWTDSKGKSQMGAVYGLARNEIQDAIYGLLGVAGNRAAVRLNWSSNAAGRIMGHQNGQLFDGGVQTQDLLEFIGIRQ